MHMHESNPAGAPAPGPPARGSRVPGSYAELKAHVKGLGLLEKQPGFITRSMLVHWGLLALTVALMFVTDSLWVQIPNAVAMAFVFVQLAFIAHDVGHRQAFRTPRRNDLFGLVHANLLLGMSFAWWLDKHNRHHANPNQHGSDPDIDIPVLAFSEEDAMEKRGLFRFLVRHQRIFFLPILFLQAFSLHVSSVRYLLTHRFKNRALEAVLLSAHFVAYFGAIFLALGFWKGLLFIGLQQALFGFYLASVFAPNHKGMDMIEADSSMGFMERQVVTARNVRPNPILDYWYGGLNYQIEHHLFPTLARNKLREAHAIIQRFCEEHGITYYQTSMLGSYREILQYLHEVSAPLRREARPTGR